LDLLAAHALSGCDSVSYPFGKGKIKAINLVLNSEVTLKEFVNPVAEEEEEAYRLKKAFPSCRNCIT